MPPQLARLFRLARKELTEVLRDRRTIMTLLVMPLLLYPLLTLAFGQFVLEDKTGAAEPAYRLGFRSEDEFREFRRAIGPETKIDAVEVEDLEAAVRASQVDVALRRQEQPPARPGESAATWEALYRKESVYGREALLHVERLCAAGNANYLSQELRKQGVQQRPGPIRLRPEPIVTEDPTARKLAVFVPLVLILMTITGAVYPAIDLTAGERERGTLEVLVAAPVPRVSLLFGKYVAVVTVAVLTALVNLGSMTVSLWLSGFAERIFGPGGIRPVTLVEIFGLVLLFAAFFSALLLVVTSFARSFKEAQASLIPLMVVSLVPGVLGLLPELRLSGPLAVVPLLNIVLLARDLLEERADPLSAAVVVIATAAYAVLAVTLAARMFGSEGVLYGEAGGWRALLRLPRTRRPEGDRSS